MSCWNEDGEELDTDASGRLDGLDLWLLPVASKCVPLVRRQDWVKEWQAELWHLRHGRRHGKVSLTGMLSLGYGLVADAMWLRLDWAQANVRGSAGACLAMLAAWCLLCAAAELLLAGSWYAFVHALAGYFFGQFLFVVIPATFAAVGTYPLQPLRCGSQHVRGKLSPRARWNLFLGAKVGLTLAIGFLTSVMMTIPSRMVLGRLADWGELAFASLVVTIGLRWALLNQEQRCQKCLRMLGEPTRVGPASRNFLDWSGMELTCPDGHGLLHVPEMRGSWCWYDLWVEVDSSWSGLFTS